MFTMIYIESWDGLGRVFRPMGRVLGRVGDFHNLYKYQSLISFIDTFGTGWDGFSKSFVGE